MSACPVWNLGGIGLCVTAPSVRINRPAIGQHPPRCLNGGACVAVCPVETIFNTADLPRWDDGDVRASRQGDDGASDLRCRTDLSPVRDSQQPRAMEPPGAGDVW